MTEAHQLVRKQKCTHPLQIKIFWALGFGFQAFNLFNLKALDVLEKKIYIYIYIVYLN